MVELVETYLDGLLRTGYAEDLSLMRSDQTCTYSRSGRRANNLVDFDPEIWKSCKVKRHQLLEPVGARFLPRRKRYVFPIVPTCLVE